MNRVYGLAILVLCFGIGTALADSLPSDPIIDIEPGTGTQAFNGTFTFTIDTTQGNCQDTDTSGIVLCGLRGEDQQLTFFQTPTLGNVTGQDITALAFTFSTAQDGFNPGTPFDSSPPHEPLFTNVQQIDAFTAIYTGSIIRHDCTQNVIDIEGSSEGSDVSCVPGNLESPNDTFSEFRVGFAEFFAPKGGVETITIRAVPEPASVTLLFTGIGALAVVRRRLGGRIK